MKQQPEEEWADYVERIKDLSIDQTVNELKSVLTELGYKEKFTYFKKEHLINALIATKEKDFVKPESKVTSLLSKS